MFAALPVEKAVPDYLRKARRMRRIVGACVVLLAVLLAVAGMLAGRVAALDGQAAVQFADETPSVPPAAEAGGEEGERAPVKTTAVPNLPALFGLTPEEAIEELQRGAQATGSAAADAGDVVERVSLELAAEEGDARSGTPTVVLGLSEEGVAVEAAYSASLASLGYGSISFTDAVLNEHVVETTLLQAGAVVEEGSVELPADKMAYSTYATDGTTLMREEYAFAGQGVANGAPCAWEAVLVYDYAAANATGNLANTVRTVQVRLTAA